MSEFPVNRREFAGLAEARDSHWVMVYGDHLRPLGYAARKIGVQWVDIS